MLRCMILEQFESLKIRRYLYAGWQSLPSQHHFFYIKLISQWHHTLNNAPINVKP